MGRFHTLDLASVQFFDLLPAIKIFKIFLQLTRMGRFHTLDLASVSLFRFEAVFKMFKILQDLSRIWGNLANETRLDLYNVVSVAHLSAHLPLPRPSYPRSSAVVIMPVGPLRPRITPNLAGYDSISRFQQLSAAFVHVNELLDLRLQALNEEHYPNRNMAGFCYCRGRLCLVTDLGVERGDEASNQHVLDTMGKQKLLCSRCGIATDVCPSGFTPAILLDVPVVLLCLRVRRLLLEHMSNVD
ncbi:hypothetical protein ARMSODRAFT_1017586 [Armillaria solidipes]|uniref:Uncharacterized protein n=1 Tax=Armillaria solidipes TaxID=1076256 RepID=A0A2H3BXM2_9AGAR|nr:hypothetical protein ARMSODRAFT_1017586 [Armillaria solidipes]